MLSKTQSSNSISKTFNTNTSLSNSNSNSNNIEADIEINFLESLSESCDYQSCDQDTENENEDFEENSDDENVEQILNHRYNTRYKKRMNEESFKQNETPSIPISYEEAKPINIPKVSKPNNRNYKKDRKARVEFDYELIDKQNLDTVPRSEPSKQKTLTESFKEYLFSSLKQSYKYITNNKSI